MVEVRSRNNTPQSCDSFWELHRRLGECYEAELSQLSLSRAALFLRAPGANERFSSPEDMQRLSSNPMVQEEGSISSEPRERRRPSFEDGRKPGGDVEKLIATSRSPKARSTNPLKSDRTSSCRSLRVPSRDATSPLPSAGMIGCEEIQRLSSTPNEENFVSSDGRRSQQRRPSVSERQSGSSLEHSVSASSPRARAAARVSSTKSYRVPSLDANSPLPPVDNPSLMDSPTRAKSGASVIGLQASHTKGSGELCAEDLVPRATWMKQGLKSVPKALQAKKSTMFSVEELSTPTPYGSELQEERTWILHPGGRLRTLWDVLTVVWLLHDILLIPLQFFDLPRSQVLDILSWSTIAFWSMDIGMSFCTGTYSKGVLVMDAALVARKYVRTWLPVDVLLVSVDWIALAAEGTRGIQGHNVLWILRLLRLVRVVRLGKMTRTAMVLQEAMQGWAVNVQYSVAMMIVRLLLLNHMVACSWWGFSHIGGRAHGWSTRYGIEEEGLLYGYATSLHWAIAQLGVGSTEIEATNSPERIFSIFVALLSLITFSTMVSSMTSMMTSYYSSKEEEVRHFSLLQRYLLHNSISTGLSQRITKFLQHAYMAQNKASSQDMQVPLLEMLSRPLMNELQLEKHQSNMMALPFLAAILKWHNLQTMDVLRTLASTAFTTCTVAAKDVIYCCGVEAVAAYLPISGAVSYLQDGRAPEQCLHVWTAEMCLWTEWYFLGDLIASDVSRILLLDMNAFCQTMASNPVTHSLAVQYAKEYTSTLRNEADSLELSDTGTCIKDTWQLGADPEVHDLMAGRGFMPELVFNTFGRGRGKGPGKQREHMGLPALNGLAARMQVIPDQILE